MQKISTQFKALNGKKISAKKDENYKDIKYK